MEKKVAEFGLALSSWPCFKKTLHAADQSMGEILHKRDRAIINNAALYVFYSLLRTVF